MMIMRLVSAVGATPNKLISVGPTDLTPKLSSIYPGLTPFTIRYRSLAFPSAADLFDVQSFFNRMFFNNIRVDVIRRTHVN